MVTSTEADPSQIDESLNTCMAQYPNWKVQLRDDALPATINKAIGDILSQRSQAVTLPEDMENIDEADKDLTKALHFLRAFIGCFQDVRVRLALQKLQPFSDKVANGKVRGRVLGALKGLPAVQACDNADDRLLEACNSFLAAFPQDTSVLSTRDSDATTVLAGMETLSASLFAIYPMSHLTFAESARSMRERFALIFTDDKEDTNKSEVKQQIRRLQFYEDLVKLEGLVKEFERLGGEPADRLRAQNSLTIMVRLDALHSTLSSTHKADAGIKKAVSGGAF